MYFHVILYIVSTTISFHENETILSLITVPENS
jgi:hypothetical protein